jgi:4-amino-4-deoxy-L-arabinose transferase-like glycosyltransferase
MTGKETIFFGRAISQERRGDYTAAGIILLYCIAWMSLRLAVSHTMELDEAEQFLAAKVLALGYRDQPPLFTWILRAAALPFGMNITTILLVKYALLFGFYFSFYRIARTFWNPGKSLVVTGALLLFPTYSYEFNRNLTHTILLAALSSVMFLVFVRLLEKKTATRYLLFGAAVGLGILSKYNIVFVLFALGMAGLSTRQGRKVLFGKGMLLSVAVGLLIVSPHVFWLIRAHFPSVHEAFGKAGAGALKGDFSLRAVSVIFSSFIEALAFPVLFLIFFRRRLSVSTALLSVLRLAPLYGLLLPLMVIVVFHMAHFSGKWLTPVFFTIPLALFSSFETPEQALKRFARLCAAAAILVFAFRAFAGFFPDVTGKAERIHIPFGRISRQLTEVLAKRGITDLNKVVVVTDDTLIAANLGADMPGAEFIIAGDRPTVPADSGRTIVAVWNANEEGSAMPKAFSGRFPADSAVGAVGAAYLHAKRLRPFILGFALMP